MIFRQRDLSVLQALGLSLAYTLETHIHAKKIDLAVPANLRCGDCLEEETERVRRIGGPSIQG